MADGLILAWNSRYMSNKQSAAKNEFMIPPHHTVEPPKAGGAAIVVRLRSQFLSIQRDSDLRAAYGLLPSAAAVVSAALILLPRMRARNYLCEYTCHNVKNLIGLFIDWNLNAYVCVRIYLIIHFRT